MPRRACRAARIPSAARIGGWRPRRRVPGFVMRHVHLEPFFAVVDVRRMLDHGVISRTRCAANLACSCGLLLVPLDSRLPWPAATPARASIHRQHGACSGSAVIGLARERCRAHFGSTGAPLFLRRGESFCAGRAAPAINSPNFFWDCGVSKGTILSRSSVVANPLMLVVRFRPLRLLGMASPLHSACRE
jgi:hypothetical protein